MAAAASPFATPAHPSPARERIALPALFTALAGGPLAWVTQLLVNYGLASATCYPLDFPRTEAVPGWGAVWYGLLAVNLLAIGVALFAAAGSHRYWRATRNEHAGHARHALEAGEGRTRFVALVGLMAGLGFAAALVFDLIALLVVPQCQG